jgi:uncharacterized protein
MDQLKIRETVEGTFISVKARPGSRKNEIRGIHDGSLVIAVTAVAEKGRANEAIIKLLAKHLGIAKSRLSIISGATGTTKSVFVEGLTGTQLLTHFPDLSQRGTR